MRTMSGVSLIGRTVLIASLGGAAWVPAAGAEETFNRGEALYENHCRSCHESWAHTRDGHQVRSLDDIRSRVRAWSLHSGLGWSQEEVDDVAQFLAERYYKLEDHD